MNATRTRAKTAPFILFAIAVAASFLVGQTVGTSRARAIAREEIETREREITRILFNYGIFETMLDWDYRSGGMLFDKLLIDAAATVPFEPYDESIKPRSNTMDPPRPLKEEER